MGFIKRLLSMGSKKGKKSKREHLGGMPYDQTAHAATQGDLLDRKKEEEEQEAKASRLLRSSSAHFAVVSEVDYTSLPPIPQRINNRNADPTGSPGRAASVQSRATTYRVKVHGRTVHTRTEFPNANPPMANNTPLRPSSVSAPSSPCGHAAPRDKLAPITPRDQSRLYKLRQDPSVASLLTMYDDNGRLDNKAFSNSPIDIDKAVDTENQAKSSARSGREPLKDEGRAQIKRGGSTLRQLMGDLNATSKVGDMFEGDISWAERFIQEGQDDSSSASSLGLETPVNPDHAFTTDPSIVSDDNRNATINPNNATFFSHKSDENDRSHDPLPAISSMEVELSMTSTIEEKMKRSYSQANSPYLNPDTPHRASEVFAFLNKPQRNRDSIARPASAPPSTSGSEDEDEEDAYGGFERPLPMLPMNMDPDSSSDSAADQVLSPIRSITTGSTIKPIVDDNFLAPHLGSTSLRPSPSSSQKTLSTTVKKTSTRQTTDNSPTSNDSPSSAGSIFEDPPQLAMIMNRTPTPVGNGLREAPRAHQVQVTPSASGPVRAPSRNSITGLTHTFSNAIGSRIPRGPKGPRTSVAMAHDFNNPFDDASTPNAAAKITTTTTATARSKSFNTPSTTPMPTPKPSHIPTATSSAAPTPAMALRTTTNNNIPASSSIPLRSGTRIPSIASSTSSKVSLTTALNATASAYPTPTPTPSSVAVGWKEKRRISSSGSWSVVSEEDMPKLVRSAVRAADVPVPGKGRGGYVVGVGKENGQVSGPRAMPTRAGSRSLDLVRDSFATNANDPNATTAKNTPYQNFDLNRPANANSAGATNLKSRLPVTPARSRAIFDAEMTPGAAPSPASSSELSPVAQQMMADLRETKRRGFVRFGGSTELGSSSPGGGAEKKRNRFVNVITNGRG